MTDSEKLDLILSEMQGMKADMQGMKDDMQDMKDHLDVVDTRLDLIRDKITDVELHLENVTDRGIKIIGEGHADLSRKLDDALKIENEKELLLIRMNYLEGELERIKKRLSELEKTA